MKCVFNVQLMRILKLLVGAALLCAAVNCNAQSYNVYGPGFQLQQQIIRQPGGNYNVYGPGFQLQQQIIRQPSIGGYGNGYGTPPNQGWNVKTMPLFNH
jgi:hypothetical protein